MENKELDQAKSYLDMSPEDKAVILIRLCKLLIKDEEEYEFVSYRLIKYGRVDAQEITAMYARIESSNTDKVTTREIMLLEATCFIGVGIGQNEQRFESGFEEIQRNIGSYQGTLFLCRQLRLAGSLYGLNWQRVEC